MVCNFYSEIDESKIFPPNQGKIEHKPRLPSTIPQITQEDVINNRGLLNRFFGNNYLVDGISVRDFGSITSAFKSLRTTINETYKTKISDPLEKNANKYYKYESHVLTSYVDPLHTDKKEHLLPGLAYTSVAYMFGSIVSRSFKPALLRLPIPLVLSIITFKATLPSTYGNTKNVLYRMESNFVSPELLATQDKSVKQVGQMAESVRTSYNKSATNVALLQEKCVKNWNALKKFSGLNV